MQYSSPAESAGFASLALRYFESYPSIAHFDTTQSSVGRISPLRPGLIRIILYALNLSHRHLPRRNIGLRAYPAFTACSRYTLGAREDSQF